MSMLQFSMNNGIVAVTGATLNKALLNTLIGMGTVFLVLIFISFLISLFRYIPEIQKKFTKSEATGTVAATSQVVEETEESEEELVDDTELVAVMIAAIQAYLGDDVPEDGLVVRSIHKVGSQHRTFGR